MEWIKESFDITSLLCSPSFVAVLAIAIGILIGKIKLLNISFDMTGVLIASVIIGAISFKFVSEENIHSLTLGLNNISALGTALFISSIGFSSGISLRRGISKQTLVILAIGDLMVFSGFGCIKILNLIDKDTSRFALLGIFCGAMTSTPGLSCASELAGIYENEVALGYGGVYLIGVIITVIASQIISGKKQRSVSSCDLLKMGKDIKNPLFCIAVVGGVGQVLGNINLFERGVSLGSTGGMLTVGIFAGVIYSLMHKRRDISTKSLSLYNKLGLVLFLSGTGIKAGTQLKTGVQPIWLLYGAMITLVPILVAYGICTVLKKGRHTTACIIAGGMTSTPAIGAIANEYDDEDLSVYSVAYIGALISIVIGIRFV